MMDMFADALADSVGTDAKVDAPATLAPSQDMAVAAEPAARSRETSIVVIDDPDIDELSLADPIAHVDPTREKSPRRLAAKTLQSDLPSSKKRKWSMELKVVEEVDVREVTCVFIRSDKDTTPVPLWPQYNVRWKDADFQNSTWIVVGNYEPWVMQLFDALTNKSVRVLAKTFTDHFRKEFLACMDKTRQPAHLKNAFEDSDCEDDDSKIGAKQSARNVAVVEPNIGGYKVVCLNYVAKMVLKLDEATLNFVTSWIVPLARQLAHSQVALAHSQVTRVHCEEALESTACESSRKLAVFQFTANPTPNIKDKVLWYPNSHAWKIVLHDKNTLSFSVAPNLSAQKYAEEKVAAYWHAVDAWNRLDNSKRLRIPITCLFGTTASD